MEARGGGGKVEVLSIAKKPSLLLVPSPMTLLLLDQTSYRKMYGREKGVYSNAAVSHTI